MKIVWFSDLDPIGSGYQNLSTQLCNGLVRAGHEVKAVGLHYGGQEHNNLFTTIPIGTVQEAFIAIYNLRALWNFDVLVVALDIPLQNFVLQKIQEFKTFKYVGIMPVEADPLCTSWAMVLLQMDLPLIISQFGTEEARKANVMSAKYIELGVDSNLWQPLEPDQRKLYRKALLNVASDDTFVVLTVADNQERKNLSAALEAFRRFTVMVPNSRYVLVTRENNPVGWSLRDLVLELGLVNHVTIMERGMDPQDLQRVYSSADCFLLTSKAEGLGLPLLEAMSMGIPCVATNCTGMRELLSDNRGLLADVKMIHRDCFGNGRRYWVDEASVVHQLRMVHQGKLPNTEEARKFVQHRTWERAVDFLSTELSSMMMEHEHETQTA